MHHGAERLGDLHLSAPPSPPKVTLNGHNFELLKLGAHVFLTFADADDSHLWPPSPYRSR
jgi:hypothetical protein